MYGFCFMGSLFRWFIVYSNTKTKYLHFYGFKEVLIFKQQPPTTCPHLLLTHPPSVSLAIFSVYLEPTCSFPRGFCCYFNCIYIQTVNHFVATISSYIFLFRQAACVCVCVCVCARARACVCKHVLSFVQLFVIPCTVAHQAPPSMGFPRQE